MLYLLAIFLPPLAVLLCGKPFQAVLNIPLCLLLWVPAVIHAILVVAESNANSRNRQLIKAMKSR